MAKKSLFTKLLSGLPSSSTHNAKEYTQVPRSDPPRLKFVFFILDWKQVQLVTDILEEEKVRFYFVTKGMGTANSEMLSLLGIGANDKAIITCLEQTVLAPILMKEVRKKLNQARPGAGIAFTIPLSAINDPILLIFKQSIFKNIKIPDISHSAGNEGENMAKEYSHDLIVAVANYGYTDELMNTAREAGAAGGTVLHARGTAHQGAVKFFGVSVQDEKEIVLILAAQDKKVDIMQAVCDAHGLNSKTQAIVFSLPVDSVLGLNLE